MPKHKEKKQIEEAKSIDMPMVTAQDLAQQQAWAQQRELEHELRMKTMRRMSDRLDKEDLSSEDLGEIATLAQALGFSRY